MSSTNLDDRVFDQMVSLRDAYQITVQFLQDVDARGTIDTDWILHAYATITDSGESVDPVALDDFLAAADAVLGR